MERPSNEQMAELRLEFREHKSDSQWRHQTVMAEFADVKEALHRQELARQDAHHQSRAPIISADTLIKVMPYAVGILVPVLIFLATGSADKAMQATAIVPR